MKLSDLKHFDLIYVATPYTKYRGGIECAFVRACVVTAQLLQAGLKVYSPIAHGHSISVHGRIDPLDHAIWLPFDAAIMAKSAAIVVVKMNGWDQSFGVAHEVETFRKAGKPVFTLDPGTLEIAGNYDFGTPA